MKYEKPLTVRVSRIIHEAENIKSLILPVEMDVEAGQFVMLWLPGIDAKPLGISYHDRHSLGVTVSAVGPWSKQVCELTAGSLVGVLGPYGNSFSLAGNRIVLVAGGYGAATLMLLAEEALRQKIRTTLIIGARSKNFLLYQDRTRTLGIETIFATDDGSFGERGFTTDILERILNGQEVDTVYSCGPELMEKKVAEICASKGIPSQISLERHMKCGFGVCGSCTIDNSGKRVCVEGTVFSGEELLRTAEFGKYHRDSSATKHNF